MSLVRRSTNARHLLGGADANGDERRPSVTALKEQAAPVCVGGPFPVYSQANDVLLDSENPVRMGAPRLDKSSDCRRAARREVLSPKSRANRPVWPDTVGEEMSLRVLSPPFAGARLG